MSQEAAASANQHHQSAEVVVDIGINLTHKTMKKKWKQVIRRAVDVGVERILLTGTSIQCSRESLALASTWYKETGVKNLWVTVGVHPHDAKSFTDETLKAMRDMLTTDPFAVAVGECGLDYNRNFSTKEDQIRAFREQVKLACELQLPLFVHEREAHDDLLRVLDQVQKDISCPQLPPIVVHCFTGNREEALTYIERGFYIGFTGTICKKERGAPLRELLPDLPLERLMIETDAPWMGFKNKSRFSEPAHVVDVARKLSETMKVPFEDVCRVTTKTAKAFFKIE